MINWKLTQEKFNRTDLSGFRPCVIMQCDNCGHTREIQIRSKKNANKPWYCLRCASKGLKSMINKTEGRTPIDTIRLVEAYKDGKSAKEISDENDIPHKTVKRLLKKSGVTMRFSEKHELNENYFDQIGERQAYWLGIIAADGHVNPAKNLFSFSLQKSDRQIVEELARDIRYDGPFRTHRGIGIKFSNKRFVSLLDELGMVSYKNGDPTMLLNSVPKSEIRHFIRGLFDGDGCISRTQRKDRPSLAYRFVLVDNLLNIGCLEEIEKIIANGCDLSLNGVKRRKTVAAITWVGTQQLIRLRQWLYDNATIFMARKRFKFPHGDIDIGRTKSGFVKERYLPGADLIYAVMHDCIPFVPPKRLDEELAYDREQILLENIEAHYDNDSIRASIPSNLETPGNQTICHFQPHYWYTGKKPIADAFGDIEVMEKCATILTHQGRRFTYGRLIREIIFNSKYNKPSQFSAGFMRSMLRKFDLSGKSVFDPCGGWGGRLIGCWAEGCEYECCETSESTCIGLSKIAKYFGYDCKIHHMSCLATEWPSYDAVITSPPFFLSEDYEGMNYESDDEFIRQFLRPFMNKVQKFARKIILHLNSQMLNAIDYKPQHVIRVITRSNARRGISNEILACWNI